MVSGVRVESLHDGDQPAIPAGLPPFAASSSRAQAGLPSVLMVRRCGHSHADGLALNGLNGMRTRTAQRGR